MGNSVINMWSVFFNNKNLNAIMLLYSNNAILLATFNRDILQGRGSIMPYFVNLFKKENLKVVFDDKPIITPVDDAFVVSGNYTFSFTENGKRMEEKARYSYVIENRKIVNHHSSVRPE
jgi:hypothetical protein